MKNIVITGAYGGMGRAAVRAFIKKGCRVFALDRRVEAGEENVIPIVCDVTSEDSVQAAFDAVKNNCDEIFALIHFAGVYQLDSLVEMETDSFDRIFNINVRGAFLVTKIFLPCLRKGSRIVITTSELAPLDPLPFTGIYAVTKAALDKYAYSLAMELQLLGISVSVLRAGAVKTDMLGASTAALERFCEKTKQFSPNADRFKKIVNRVEARHIEADKLARKLVRIVHRKKPAFAYAINRNPLLLLLNALPKRLQLFIIKQILK